ncbi:uncharacterized protein B0H18DRAFT_983958 [Fomitopsis serialis]|uniref:uncharacterized protein n=1 Tax=Fomitopsis serialis TaxID=139415 RepID=UPI002007A3DE|nr:uncharacterized protein B0H18DRAFT_983958 [Neoantrodia serialis]KAH9933483.1 hypothetical protein B0H18DRAFT_983958 [Neoantrodia serialis]
MNWELAIRTCMTSEFGRREAFGNVYRLDGSTGEYCYEKKEGVRYELSATFSESTEVSKFSSEILGRVEEIIQGVDIRNDDPDYDTRTWVFDVVHALRAEGM